MSFSARDFVRYQLPAVLWALLIFLASSVPSHRMPWLPVKFGDKLGHFVVFFIFGLFLHRALTQAESLSGARWKKLAVSLLIAIGYGMLDELYQGTVPGRRVDVGDLLADTAGAASAMAWIAFRSRRTETATGRKSGIGEKRNRLK